MQPGNQPDPSHADAASGQFTVTKNGRPKSAGTTTPGLGCRAGVRPIAREFVEILTVALYVSGESTRPPHLFYSPQWPTHRVEMAVGNGGRTTTAELRSDNRGDGRGLRPHHPAEESSRRSVNAVLGHRQRDADPDRASTARQVTTRGLAAWRIAHCSRFVVAGWNGEGWLGHVFD
jgi:hypothetical protein